MYRMYGTGQGLMLSSGSFLMFVSPGCCHTSKLCEFSVIMRLIEGEASSLCEAFIKFDAVIRPFLILYHKDDFDCIFLSTTMALAQT